MFHLRLEDRHLLSGEGMELRLDLGVVGYEHFEKVVF